MAATIGTYVLITPARNEANFVELTIKSVVSQTIRPLKWVIVNDGSTDGTDDIARRYAADHPWIEVLQMPERSERTFSGKSHALNAGYARVRDLAYDAVGTLDADISFGPDYFAFLLQMLSDNPGLGLVGTPFNEGVKRAYDYRFVNIEHVSGACQFFRRECFDRIGGYTPIAGGGVDYIMVITARVLGWGTRTFTERESVHHRTMGTAQHGVLRARFKVGEKDYAFGNDPVWQLFRCAYQMTKAPFLVGGVLVMGGYAWSAVRRAQRPISSAVVAFVRHEQRQRLLALVKTPWWKRGTPPRREPMSRSGSSKGLAS